MRLEDSAMKQMQPEAPVGVLDVDALRAFGDGVGAAAFPTLLETFLQEMRNWVAALPAAVASGDLGVVRRTAHNIKSCAGTLGASILRAEAAALERAARDGDADLATGLVGSLRNTAAPALDAVDSFRARL